MKNVKHVSGKTVSDLLEQISKYRDGLLILLSCTYILGYVVWSLHAMVNHLGLLPAIDAQYFLAGIVPGVVIYLTYLFLTHSRSVSAVLLKLLRPRRNGLRRYTLPFLIFVEVALLIAQAFSLDWSRALDWSYRPLWKEHRITLVLLWLGCPLVFLLLHTAPTQRLTSIGTRRSLDVRRISSSVNGVFFSLSLILFYIFWAYPTLPQELGGVKPRCAFIDVDATKVSEQTRSAIFEPTNDRTGVLSSVKLTVLYTGSEFLLVKPELNQGAPTYELKRGELTVIRWCD